MRVYTNSDAICIEFEDTEAVTAVEVLEFLKGKASNKASVKALEAIIGEIVQQPPYH